MIDGHWRTKKNSPCMKDGKCKKRCSRDLHDATVAYNDVYPHYRWRLSQNDGHFIDLYRCKNYFKVHNRLVMATLLSFKTFKTYINFEYYDSVKSIKDICDIQIYIRRIRLAPFTVIDPTVMNICICVYCYLTDVDCNHSKN